METTTTEVRERLTEMKAESLTEKQLVAKRAVIRRVRQSRTERGPCTRCGGLGGAHHWPGFTCYRCNGLGSRTHEVEQVRFYGPEHALEADLDRALTQLIDGRRIDAQIAAEKAEREAALAASWDAALAEDAERTAAGRCGRAPGLVGTEGERVELEVTVTRTMVLDGHYGPKMLVAMETDEADRLVTFGTGDSLWDLRSGDRIRIVGTVKSHGERDGVPQTTLTRVKVAS